MSAAIRTLADHTNDAPFFHTFPVWVIQALHNKGIPAQRVTKIKVMPKTAEVEFTTAHEVVAVPNPDAVLKVRRADAFPGRASE